MALRLSLALQNGIADLGMARLLGGGKITFYSGPQPTDANQSVSSQGGSPLCVFTNNGAAYTPEVKATGSVTFSGTVAAATCTSVKVNSIEIMGSTFTDATGVLADFAAGVARLINNNPANLLYTASAALGVVTLTAKTGLGATVNGMVVAATVTTITANEVNIGSGVSGVSAVNGLHFEVASAGAILKNSDEVWQGTASASGTAGWFRWTASVADAGALDSTGQYMRLDGVVAASGGELSGSTAITSGAVQTITADQFSLNSQ
jgi:hypothetical protein